MFKIVKGNICFCSCFTVCFSLLICSITSPDNLFAEIICTNQIRSSPTTYRKCIIAGDFNAHMPLLGYDD